MFLGQGSLNSYYQTAPTYPFWHMFRIKETHESLILTVTMTTHPNTSKKPVSHD